MTNHALREWIAATGLDQDEVGALCGYEKTHFNKIVNGKNKLNRDKAIAIALALSRFFEREVKPADLLRIPNVQNAGRNDTGSVIVLPPQSKGEPMIELAKPVIAALVEKLGAKVVARLALEAEKEDQPRPLERQKTS